MVAGVLAVGLLILAGAGCERAERQPAAPAGSPAEVTPRDLGETGMDMPVERPVAPEEAVEAPATEYPATEEPQE